MAAHLRTHCMSAVSYTLNVRCVVHIVCALAVPSALARPKRTLALASGGPDVESSPGGFQCGFLRGFFSVECLGYLGNSDDDFFPREISAQPDMRRCRIFPYPRGSTVSDFFAAGGGGPRRKFSHPRAKFFTTTAGKSTDPCIRFRCPYMSTFISLLGAV